MLTFLLSFSCAILISFYTLKVYFKRKKYEHIPGPKTNGILEFFLGNFTEITKALKNGKIVPDKYIEWSKEYGSVFKFEILNNFIVVLTEPEAIRDVLIVKNFPKPNAVYKISGYPFNERFLGSGLVTEFNEPKWRHRRGLFNAGFNKSFLMDCLTDFNSKTDLLMEKLRLKADGKTQIDLLTEINRLTLDVISSVAFGLDIDSVNDSNNKLSYFIGQSLEGLNNLFLDPFITYKPNYYNKVKEYKNAIKNLRKFGKEAILERLKKIENKEYIKNDILSIILNNSKNDEVDIDLLVDDFITFFNAGQETTANALTFCFLELINNPSVLSKLIHEIDQVLGERNEINAEDLSKLEYAECVFKEALRKYPPAVQFIRETNDKFSVNGFELPVGTWIAISPYVLGRHPKYFKDPEKFLPERFLKNSTLSSDYKINNYTFIPFSLGPRSCIGMNFAQIEGRVLLVKLIKNFEFKLDPLQTMKYIERITLKPTDGCKCYLTDKKKCFYK